MSFLVDTHYMIWSLLDPAKIDTGTRALLQSSEYVKFVSVVSFWEISLKYSLGKIDLQGIDPEGILAAAAGGGYHLLPIEAHVVASSHRLPKNQNHRDPFDRLLVWQCIQADLAMLTADTRIKDYQQYGLKLP